ncbi:MAG: flagellar hook-length control protein FliK [Pseudomonadota bacterium]
MNASLPSVQPAPQAAAQQPQSAVPGAAADMPFSEVLSGEMAQRQASRPAEGESAAAGTPPGAQPGHSAEDAPPATEVVADPAQAGLPDTMLALAQQPEWLKPALATTDADPADAAPIESAASATPTDALLQFAVPAGAPATLAAGAPSPAGTRSQAGQMPTARIAAQTQATLRDAPAGADLPSALSDKALPAGLSQAAESTSAGNAMPNFMTAMTAAQTTQLVATAAAPLQASERLNPPVGTPAWNQALGDRIVWMAAGNQQAATLTLNPPDLGPLQVVVNVSNEQATASFFAAQPEVRQALEAALPRLRDMMQDAGIQLGQATVSADTPRQQDMQERSQQTSAPFMGDDNAASSEQVSVLPQPVRAGRGLVDTFA